MEVVGIVAGVVVGLALVWAGVLKLVEGPAWLKQAADMDVPRPIAVVVPYVEIVVGVPLALHLFPPWPAVAALVMLGAYTVLIVRRIADGSRPPCACFGSKSKRPLGAYHVVRNLVLIAVAVVALIWG
jgi:uncharacterized membrane protein YphA (DoxX/SURF4 family)